MLFFRLSTPRMGFLKIHPARPQPLCKNRPDLHLLPVFQLNIASRQVNTPDIIPVHHRVPAALQETVRLAVFQELPDGDIGNIQLLIPHMDNQRMAARLRIGHFLQIHSDENPVFPEILHTFFSALPPDDAERR